MLEQVRGLLRPLPRVRLVALGLTGTAAERLSVLPAAQEHILAQEDGKERLLPVRHGAVAGVRARGARTRRRSGSATTSASSRRSARSWPRARPASGGPTRSSTTRSARSSRGRSPPTRSIDIFAAAGLKKPDISILSDEFLAEVRGMPAAEPRRGAAAEAARGRDQVALAAERRPGALVRGAARAGAPPLPEPGDRDGPGHRGADRAGEGHARRRTPAATSWASPRTSSPSTTRSRRTTARWRSSASPSSWPSPAS